VAERTATWQRQSVLQRRRQVARRIPEWREARARHADLVGQHTHVRRPLQERQKNTAKAKRDSQPEMCTRAIKPWASRRVAVSTSGVTALNTAETGAKTKWTA